MLSSRLFIPLVILAALFPCFAGAAVLDSSITSIGTLGVATANQSNTGEIASMISDGDRLYVGGVFNVVGEVSGTGVPLDATTGATPVDYRRFNNDVNAVVPDGSGGWYVGGFFTKVDGTSRNRIAHITSTGVLDLAFDPNAGGSVYSLLLDGTTLYAGGSFTTVNGGTARNRLAAFDTTTGIATSFDPNVSDISWALALSGTTLYAGGQFTTVNGGTTRNRLAAFDTTTGLATAFDPNVNSTIQALLLDATTLYVGGSFTTVNGGTARNRLAALDTTTGLATAFDPNMGSGVMELALNGTTLYAGGQFTTVNGGTTRNRLAALDTTTGLATAFDPNLNQAANGIALSGDGSTLYAGGQFTTVNGGTTRNRLAAFDTTTGTATVFSQFVEMTVNVLSLDGSTLFAGGEFRLVNCVSRNGFMAIDLATDTLSSFNPNFNGQVRAMVLDGTTLYTGGGFTTVNGGTTRNRLAAIDTSTGLATSFDPNLNSTAESLVLDGDTLYVGGDFSTVNGATSRSRIAGLDTTTGIADDFSPPLFALSYGGPSGSANYVSSLYLTENALYAGGAFSEVGSDLQMSITSFARELDPVTPSSAGSSGSLLSPEQLARLFATPTPSPAPGSHNPSEFGLREGDLISAYPSGDPDVYIVNQWGIRRLFLNPIIFNFYGHLGGYSAVRTITTTIRDVFPVSGLFRNCEINDPKVYALETTGEDTGTLHHIALSGDDAVRQDPDFFKKVFCINSNEFNWYSKSPTPYTALSQLPVYRR